MTSTLPYLMVFLPTVVMRADRTGGMSLPSVSLLRMEQLELAEEVQLPSPPALVRLSVYPLYIWALVMLVQSNEPVP